MIKDIHDKFTDFENLEFVRETLRNDYLKWYIRHKLTEDILVETLKPGTTPLKVFRDFAEEILFGVNTIEAEHLLLTGEDLADSHRKVIDDRDKGIIQRSLGFKVLNDFLKGHAALPEEITFIAGMKGFGKSLLLKAIESILIDEGVCVLSVNLEMSKASNTDRLICIRHGIPLEDLHKKDMGPRLRGAIDQALDEISRIPNYRYCPSEQMDVTQLDQLIAEAKRDFKRAGVLPEDGYMIVMLDSADMLEGFLDPRQIKAQSLKLLASIRKNKVHLCGLVQMNENMMRGGGKLFKTPEDLEHLRFTFKDIDGGAHYAARARLVLTINRPLHLKKMFFPEMSDRWAFEDDILNLVVAKANDADISGNLPLLFNGAAMRITEFVPSDNVYATE